MRICERILFVTVGMFYLLFNGISLFQIASLKGRIVELELQCSGKVSLFFTSFRI